MTDTANGQTDARTVPDLVQIALDRAMALAPDDAPEEVLIAASFVQELDSEDVYEVSDARATAVRDMIHAADTFELDAEDLLPRLIDSDGMIFATRARNTGIFEEDSLGANDLVSFTAYEDEDEDGIPLVVVEMAYIPGPEAEDDAFIGEANASSITITLRNDAPGDGDTKGLRGDAFFGNGDQVEDEGSVMTILATLSLLLDQLADGEDGFVALNA